MKFHEKLSFKLLVLLSHFNEIECIVGGYEAQRHRNDSKVVLKIVLCRLILKQLNVFSNQFKVNRIWFRLTLDFMFVVVH